MNSSLMENLWIVWTKFFGDKSLEGEDSPNGFWWGGGFLLENLWSIF